MKTFAFVGVNSKGRVKPGIGSSKRKKQVADCCKTFLIETKLCLKYADAHTFFYFKKK